MMIRFQRRDAVALAIVLAIAPAWRGARAADTATSATNDSNVLEEIVVTAEKRTETALTTPVALTAYSDDALKLHQVVTVADLQNVDPSINVSKGGFGDTVTIRGVTSVDGTSKGTPGIAFNIDGVTINRGQEQAEAFFDLERVEVLKGPQGTLYGNSSTGGALNIITAKPKNQYEASADVTVGNFNTRRTTAVINLPFTDTVAVRAAVNYNSHDGYLTLADGTPYSSGENDLTARLSGLVKFTDDMSLLVQETIGTIGGPGSGSANWDAYQNSPTGSGQRVVLPNPFEQRMNDTFSNLQSQFNWGLGPIQLTYVGGYLLYSADEHTASTNNPVSNDGADVTPTYNWGNYRGHFLTDSHELRLSNKEPGPLDWVLGANYFKENIHESDHRWNAPVDPDGSPPAVANSVNGIDPLNNTLHVAKGVFGQATWHATSQLDLTLGARETKDTTNRYGTFAPGSGPPTATPNGWLNPSGKPCVAPDDCVGFPNNGAESDSKFTYRANVAFHFTPTQMLYGTVSTGFKGGNFNDFCASGGPCPYKPETLTAYEIGYKGRPVDNFEWNSDLFYYNYSGRQFSQFVFINGNPVIFTDVAPAKIEGWENEITYRPTHDDDVHLNVTLLRSHYVNLLTTQVGSPPFGIPGATYIDLAGKTLDNTPDVALTLQYSHTFNLSNGGSLVLEADTKYSSSFSQNGIDPYIPFTQPSFTRSNATIRYNYPGSKFYVGAFVTNIENKLQITGSPGGGNSNPDGTETDKNGWTVGVNDPRTWGFTFGVKL